MTMFKVELPEDKPIWKHTTPTTPSSGEKCKNCGYDKIEGKNCGCPMVFTPTTNGEGWRDKYNVFVKDVREYGEFSEVLASHVESFISTLLTQAREEERNRIVKMIEHGMPQPEDWLGWTSEQRRAYLKGVRAVLKTLTASLQSKDKNK